MEIRLKTGEVMYESELRSHLLANGGPSFGELNEEVLEALEAEIVLEGPQPSPTRYQVTFRDGVEQIDGKWYTKYSVADLDAEGIAAKDAEVAKSVRTERNTKLADCDWTQLADSTADKEAWATYRAALRDVPSQAGFPHEVEWPTSPAGK